MNQISRNESWPSKENVRDPIGSLELKQESESVTSGGHVGMDAEQFEQRLRELQAMTRQDVATELFEQAYEDLLNDVRALPGPRYEKLERMQRVLMHQSEWLMNEWLKAKRSDYVEGMTDAGYGH